MTLAAFAISDLWLGWHKRIGFVWLVPAQLVTVAPADAARRWGRALGSGFLTDAPYAAFQAAMFVPVILGRVELSIGVVVVFVTTRVVPYLSASSRAWAEGLADQQWRGRSLLFNAARWLSVFSVLLAAAAAVWLLRQG